MRWAVWGLVLVLTLGACAAERRGGGGEPVSASAASAMCLKGCARDHGVCGDALSARRDTSPLFGAAAGCERQLRECRRRCAPPE